MVRAVWFVNEETLGVVDWVDEDAVQPDGVEAGLVKGGDLEGGGEWVVRGDGEVDVAFGPRGWGAEVTAVEGTGVDDGWAGHGREGSGD